MKWVLVLILALCGSCQKGIEGEVICRETPPSLLGRHLSIGDSKEAIRTVLGSPFDRLTTPFQREVWVYPSCSIQPIYSNSDAAGWYFFDHPHTPIYLVLHLDGEGKLSGLSTQPVEHIPNVIQKFAIKKYDVY